MDKFGHIGHFINPSPAVSVYKWERDPGVSFRPLLTPLGVTGMAKYFFWPENGWPSARPKISYLGPVSVP